MQPFAHFCSFPILHGNINKSTLAVACFIDVHSCYYCNVISCPPSSEGRVNVNLMFSTFLCVIRDIIVTILTCPLSAGEPDTPVLSPDRMKVERNTFYIPLQHVDQGASPLQHFNLRYRKVTDAPSAWVSTLYLQPSFCLIRALRIKTAPSGRRCSCRPVPTPYPSKTCLLGQAMKWRLRRSTSMVPPSLPHLTLPLESSQVSAHAFLTALEFTAPSSVDEC